MKMIYQRRGGPILSWASGYPPRQSRAAETRGLGDAGDGLGDVPSPYQVVEDVPRYVLPGSPEPISGVVDSVQSVTGVVGMAIGTYHGYRRTGSVGWTAVWALAGGLFPLFTGIVAFAQGFGQPKSSPLHHSVASRKTQVGHHTSRGTSRKTVRMNPARSMLTGPGWSTARAKLASAARRNPKRKRRGR